MTPFVCNHDKRCENVRLCCMDTEMTLTEADAKRLDELGYRRDEYLIHAEDGFCQLKNVDGHCVFYDVESRLCKVYEARPEGCRYYPIVYDVRKRRCTVDRECPSSITITRDDIKRVCHRVKRLVERLMREATLNEGPC